MDGRAEVENDDGLTREPDEQPADRRPGGHAEEEEADGYFPAYLFPDPDDDVEVDIELSEAQWLDALLESLADDEDDEDGRWARNSSSCDNSSLRNSTSGALCFRRARI